MQKKVLAVSLMFTKFIFYGSICQLLITGLLFGHGVTENMHLAYNDSTELSETNSDIVVNGKVTDENGEGLPGASIIVKGDISGTTTDINGNFKLNVSDEATLVVSYIGFVSQEVYLAGRSVLDVQLKEDFSQLDEVVVVGYGTQNKRDITGSISSIDEEDFNVGGISGVEQLVQGRTAGLQISSQSAAPGGDFVIRIRGNNSISNSNQPLFVVDGFPMDELDNSINPNNIKSIEILKDASATAIYGTRGANGVVIITTKNAEKGRISINYNVEYGKQVVSNLDAYDFLDTREFAENQNLLSRVNGANPIYSEGRIDSLELAFGSTYWMQVAFVDGSTVNHQVSISSGNDKSNIYFSGGYFQQNGIVPNTKFERYTSRINFDQNLIEDKLKFGLNLGITYTNTNFLGFNAGNLQTNIMRNIFHDAKPYVPSNLDDLTDDEIDLLGGLRPVSPLQTIYAAKNESKSTFILSTGFLEYQIIEGLKVKALLGTRVKSGKDYGYLSQESNIVAGTLEPGESSLGQNNSTDILFEGTINYQKQFGRHRINAIIGYTNQKVKSEYFSAGAKDFTSNNLQWNSLQSGATPTTPVSGLTERQLISYLGRVNYDYDDRYLLSLTVRRDGSSKFGPDNKWANFPAVAVGWKVHNEGFMNGQSLFSNLKLRASYGITGSERFRVGLAQTQFNANASVTLDGNNQSIGTVPSVLGNNSLTWEETKQFNAPLDLGFLNDRVTLDLDYYRKNTTKLIVNKSLPPSFGFSNIITNVGEIENSGFEILLTTHNVSTSDFQWSTDFNLSVNNNEIKEVLLPDGAEFLDGANLRPIGGMPVTPYTVIKEGLPVNTFFGYVTRGILQDGEVDDIQPDAVPGDALYEDINGDGVLTSDDRTALGQGYPKYMFGLTNTVTYKSLQLSFFISGVYDVDVLNVNKMIGHRTNRLTSVMDRWTPETPEGTQPFKEHSGQFWLNDQLVENADYIRLKNVSLSYSIPTQKLGWNFITNLQVYASGSNLLTWTNYSGFDPEVNGTLDSNSNLNIGAGVDMYSYPMQKSYAVGLKVGF